MEGSVRAVAAVRAMPWGEIGDGLALVAPEAAEEGVGVALGPAGDALGERVVLTEPAWAKKLSDEDRRGLTALFWSNVNPYGTFRLDMDKRLDLGLTGSRSRTPAGAADRPVTQTR
ncbi:hypothetical protein ACFRAO_33945 [Streptomyces sp. NPDC056656]|uniref:hypothetical protein n=1 Tax=Streptomyces sp. NPDC056656 TaxID=3345895 RepID=UPI0036B0F407